MEAVIKTGGKQFYVQKGDIIEAEITDSTNLISDPKQLKSAKVKAKILSFVKGKKVKVFKFRRRQNSKTLNGHRQNYQKMEIISIDK